jgi:hypothetical protein
LELRFQGAGGREVFVGVLRWSLGAVLQDGKGCCNGHEGWSFILARMFARRGLGAKGEYRGWMRALYISQVDERWE